MTPAELVPVPYTWVLALSAVLFAIGVVGVHHLRVDGEGQEFLLAAHHALDHTATGTGLDGAALQLLLDLGHLLLHLRRLAHHVADPLGHCLFSFVEP